jgi:hypothetical protein
MCCIFVFYLPREQLAVPDRVQDKGAAAKTIYHSCLILWHEIKLKMHFDYVGGEFVI